MRRTVELRGNDRYTAAKIILWGKLPTLENLVGSDLEYQVGKSNKLVWVLVLVVVGILVLGVGAYVAFTKRSEARGPVVAPVSAEHQKWCALRKTWQEQVSALSADIMLKSIRPEDAADLKKLMAKRNVVCQEQAGKLETLLKTAGAAIQGVEVALVKEGKVRANISVEIHNLLAKYLASPDIKETREALEKAQKAMKRRIVAQHGKFDREVAQALAAIKGCTGIYRGPFTDEGISASPYVSWKELDLRREQAAKRLDARVKELEPMEQYGHQIYHELIRRYRKQLAGCYRTAKRHKAGVSSILKVLVTLKGNGTVAKLGLIDAKPADEKVLDCLLNGAAKWKLPQPAKAGDRVAIQIDFSSM